MGRRKQKSLINPQGILGALAVVAVLWVLVQLLSSPIFLKGAGFLLLIFVAVPVAYLIARHYQQSEARRTLLEKAQTIVENAIELLRGRGETAIADNNAIVGLLVNSASRIAARAMA